MFKCKFSGGLRYRHGKVCEVQQAVVHWWKSSAVPASPPAWDAPAPQMPRDDSSLFEGTGKAWKRICWESIAMGVAAKSGSFLT